MNKAFIAVTSVEICDICDSLYTTALSLMFKNTSHNIVPNVIKLQNSWYRQTEFMKPN